MKKSISAATLSMNAGTRTFLLCVMALAYPLTSAGFELGAYGELLYQRKFTSWVTVTAAFVALAIIPRKQTGVRNIDMLVLAVPVCWLVISQAVGSHSDGAITRPVLFLLATGTYVFCLPYAIFLVVQILKPDLLILTSNCFSLWLVAIGALFILMGYTLGANNGLVMTCEEFSLAGDMPPDNCRPAPDS